MDQFNTPWRVTAAAIYTTPTDSRVYGTLDIDVTDAKRFLDKKRNIRLYAAGGPLMVYADYSSDREETPDGPGDSEIYETHESAFGLGLYARAGFEFRLYEKGMLGLGARGTWSSVDLSDVGGSTDLTGVAAFISFTAGL